jgi:hypothetical protein
MSIAWNTLSESPEVITECSIVFRLSVAISYTSTLQKEKQNLYYL